MRCLFVYYNTFRTTFINIGLASLISIAKAEDFECDLFDTTYIEDGDICENFKKKLEGFCPDVLAITCCSPDWSNIKNLLALTITKEVKDEICIIVGGPHPTAVPEPVIDFPLIDIVAIGEGEIVFRNVLKSITNNVGFEKNRGIWYKQNGHVIKTPLERMVKELDDLPFPDWSLFDSKHFSKRSDQFDKKRTAVALIETSRGCPYACNYCLNSFYRELYQEQISCYHREKSPERVIAEIEQKVQEFNLSAMVFIDDTFVVNPDRLEKIVKLYTQKINLPFYLSTRAETLNHKTVSLLVEMGAKEIRIGIESGNERYRRDMLGRNISNRELIERTQLIKQYGTKILTYNMIGLPFETKEMIQETIELNQIIAPDYCIVSVFCPLPGTKLFNLCVEKDLFIAEDPNNFDFASINSTIKLEVDQAELSSLRKSFPNYLPYKLFLAM